MANRRASAAERLSQTREIAAVDPLGPRTGLVSHQLSERFADTSASAVLSKLIKQPSARRWERDSDIQKLEHGAQACRVWAQCCTESDFVDSK